MKRSFRTLSLLAWLNLRRNVRRSVLTAAAMIVGLALQNLSRALADGAHEDWVESGVRLGSGHIAMRHPDYERRAAIEFRLGPDQISRALAAAADPQLAARIRAVAVRLSVTGLANSPEGAVPVLVMGVDPAAELEFARLHDRLQSGRYLEPGDGLHAFIGQRLADRLELQLGSRFVLTAQDANGDMSGQLVRVAGTFATGVPEIDEGLLQIPIATARHWLAVGDDATEVSVLLESSYDVPAVLDVLRGELPDPDLQVINWREAMPELDSAIRLDDWGDFIFHGILLVVVALAIVNTVLMSVLHRTREFGVVRALGFTRFEAGAQVFMEGMALTFVSGAIGTAIGLGGTWLFFRNGLDYSFLLGDMTTAGVLIEPVIHPIFRFMHVIQSAVVILVVGGTACLYPAWRATRIDIVDSMKFEA